MMKSVMIALTLTAASPAIAQTNAPVATTAPGMTTGTPLASEIAGKLFPDGTYRKMLGPAMTKMLSGMTDSMTTMPIGPLLKSFGLPEEQATKLDTSTLGEIMAVTDPHYRERMSRGMDAMFSAMIPMFEKLEPDLRAGLSVSLDNRFSPAELNDLKTFFATPTGSSFASQQMMLFMDPAVMGRMQTAMPKVMEAMPKMIAAMTEATKDLPKAKTFKDLTPAERARLSQLLGIDPEKTKQ
jgi:hypothetical protein